MHSIVYFLVSGISFIGLAFLNNKLCKSIQEAFFQLKEKEQYFDDLKEKDGLIAAEVLNLNKKLDSLMAVYDIAKDLSKSQEKEELLNTFKDRLMFILSIDDCKIITDKPSIEDGDSYKTFPIKIEDKTVRYLLLGKNQKLDENLLTVTLNQLSLALRRIMLYEEIQRLSIIDGLTGIYCRRYFEERASQEFSRAEHYGLKLSLLMLDIDYFKSYNDTFGHIVGDILLKEIAGILNSGLRQIDMCARWGGEEFCVLLPDTTKEGAFLVAERIRQSVEQTEIKAYDEKVRVTVSVGVATYPEDSKEYNSLVDKADVALYKAKKLGRNLVFVSGMKES